MLSHAAGHEVNVVGWESMRAQGIQKRSDTMSLQCRQSRVRGIEILRGRPTWRLFEEDIANKVSAVYSSF